MPGLEALAPLYTAHLFPPLHAELLTLLRGLAPDDWARPTLAGAWRVRDVAAHLLDGDLRKLAGGRDQHPLTDRAPASFADVLDLINDLNAGGVGYARRLSPRLLIDLLEVTGRWVSAYVAELPPHGEAAFPVAWADETRSEHWMDIGREYTERWHHQMQIRDAVGAPRLLDPRWLQPVLDLSVRAFRRAYKEVPAAPGTAAVFAVEHAGAWTVRREAAGWQVLRGADPDAAATLVTDADSAWKLLFNALPADAARARVSLRGEPALLAPMLGARALMV